VLGGEHPEVAYTLNNLGTVMRAEGKLDEARGYYERALAIREKTLGPEHPDVAASVDHLGKLAIDEGKPAEAYAWFERALAIREKTLSPEHPDVATCLTGLGQALIGQGKPGDARALIERALSIQTTNDVHPALLAETRFALARALWDAPVDVEADRARARELAEQARDGCVHADLIAGRLPGEIQSWLAEHGG
jgi:Tfp pilus assembly protein PilF